MFNFLPITDPWHADLRTNHFEIERDRHEIRLNRKGWKLAWFRPLIVPLLDALLVLGAALSTGPAGAEGKPPSPGTMLAWLFPALLVRLVFLFWNLRHTFNQVVRNRTVHRVITSTIALPIDPSPRARVDRDRPLVLDGVELPASEVREVVITGIAFVTARKSNPLMVGQRMTCELLDRMEDLPPPWSTTDPSCAPIFSPTIVFDGCAYELCATVDTVEAMAFTRLLRHAFGFTGPCTLMGVHPFQIRENKTLEGTLFPALSTLRNRCTTTVFRHRGGSGTLRPCTSMD